MARLIRLGVLITRHSVCIFIYRVVPLTYTLSTATKNIPWCARIPKQPLACMCAMAACLTQRTVVGIPRYRHCWIADQSAWRSLFSVSLSPSLFLLAAPSANAESLSKPPFWQQHCWGPPKSIREQYTGSQRGPVGLLAHGKTYARAHDSV